MLALSWVAAIVACLAYGVASILQSVGARRVAAATGLTGIALILRQVPYLLGLGGDALGFVANVVALQELPLFLVESIVAASVGVTAVIAVRLGARLGVAGWVGLAVLGAGLVLLSLTAVEGRSDHLELAARAVVLACAVIPLVVGIVGLRLSGRRSAIVLAVAAGLGFTGVAVAARGLRFHPGWQVLLDPLVWAIAAYGLIAIGLFGVALQRGSVTVVTAVTFAIEVVVPSAIGVLALGDAIAPGLGGVALLGVGCAVGGTVLLSRFTPEESG